MIEPMEFGNHILVMLAYILYIYIYIYISQIFFRILYGYKQLVFKDELKDKTSTRNNSVFL